MSNINLLGTLFNLKWSIFGHRTILIYIEKMITFFAGLSLNTVLVSNNFFLCLNQQKQSKTFSFSGSSGPENLDQTAVGPDLI
jgi:hypothetical protein